MKRVLSLVFAGAFVLVAVAFALQTKSAYPLLDWAKKAAADRPTVAVLLEFGQKDISTRDWSGKAIVKGAKVSHREGYRFREKDKLVGTDAWEASSRLQIRVPKGQPAISKVEPLASVGIVLHLQDVQPDAKLSIVLKNGEKAEVALANVLAGKSESLWNGTAVARLTTTASPIAVEPLEEDFPAAAHAPDGTLWVAYIAYKHRDPARRIEAVPMPDAPKDFKSFYKPEFADQLLVRSYKEGKWSAPQTITGAKEDIARCAVAASADGDVWVVYSAHRDGNFDLYARKIDAQGKLHGEKRLTTNPGADMTPVMTTDALGNPWLACQSWNEKGQAGIEVFHLAQGKWERQQRIQGDEGENCWHPALAASPAGDVAVAYDIYSQGSYDVRVTLLNARNGARLDFPVAAGPKFEARPSVVYDLAGRLWIAYEEGPEKWGKDYGALVPDKGNPLYNERSVRVVCRDTDGALKRATAELFTSHVAPPVLPFDAIKISKFEKSTKYSYPKIGIDGQGRVWLAYRENSGNRSSSQAGSIWRSYVRRLDGQHWSEPVEVHHSDGLHDYRPVLLPHRAGGLLIVHNTDGRFTTPETIDNQIYASTIDLPARATVLQLVEHEPGQHTPGPDFAQENAAVKRLKSHRLKVAGKTYQYLRGEYHRHTEISWDGSPDGTLEDMFRYAIDAAQLDWIGNADHDNGAGREYTWWLTQKYSDAYFSPGAFTTMFTYERSVSYPHGHRNVMFAQRGILTLPRLAPPADLDNPPGNVHPDDTKMLYRYLREFDGICASHTSATSMGTDWRDHDPVVEPIVEIYQGDRMSYEIEGAPRAGYDPKTAKEPANVAGWYPKGFINLALQKGNKLGFQASSDHWSTHISFFIILSEGRERKQLLDAVKKRHCYAATDYILAEFRSGDRMMGDDLVTATPPVFQINVVGTGKLAKIDVLRDSEVIDTLKPNGNTFKGDWIDLKAKEGSHYYYLRVLQEDQEIAWITPIWVTLKK